jgi:hypothetical protein
VVQVKEHDRPERDTAALVALAVVGVLLVLFSSTHGVVLSSLGCLSDSPHDQRFCGGGTRAQLLASLCVLSFPALNAVIAVVAVKRARVGYILLAASALAIAGFVFNIGWLTS